MATRNQYDYLDRVIVSGEFAVDGELRDPDEVTCYLKTPAKEVLTFVFGVDPNVTRVGQGLFECYHDVDQAGRWEYRWYGTGGVFGAGEGSFDVRQSAFAPPA
jgi:hypothetical protein